MDASNVSFISGATFYLLGKNITAFHMDRCIEKNIISTNYESYTFSHVIM